ncbi:MAG: DUF362 domain-containing protein [Desulfobacterales bacterium]|nr:DUF362 domain-containing protein [Desulfobacterales bacterium]
MTKQSVSASVDNTVYIRRCEDYDPAVISRLIGEGMAALDYVPAGNVFVKPNVVFASKDPKFGIGAYTHNAVIEAALGTLGDAHGVRRVDMGENTGIGVPTRFNYKQAGYYDTVRRVRKKAKAAVDIFCIDEEPRDSVFIGGVVHDNLRVSRKMARADSKVYLPKLKCHNITNMTGAVKLNVGICSDDERAIKHDFMLIEKIVDLLTAGYPDFIVMDAIDIGVANEAIPDMRKLGLLIMGKNPMAVDLVGAHLLGYHRDDVPYLKRAVERGYAPGRLEDVTLAGDICTIEELDKQASRILPYDDEYTKWQDIQKEFDRLETPLRFFWGHSRNEDKSQCKYGCIMGLKMFLSFFERHAGADAFRTATPAVLVIGNVAETIDAKGNEVFLIGSCAKADVINAKKVHHIDQCFTTTSELNLVIGNRLGMTTPFLKAPYLVPFVYNLLIAATRKLISMRYFQDIGHFLAHGLVRRV